jgi:hypothetical protein
MLTFDAYNNYKLFLEKQSTVQGRKDSVLLESVAPGKGEKRDTQNDEKDQLLTQTKSDVERCVALIMGKYKFFGEFIYKFRFLYTYRVNTMATDGKNIFINPKFCSTLTDKQIVFILCHEVLHNLLSHFLRQTNKGANDHKKWNYATDYEINPLLVEEGLLTASEVKNDIKGLYEEKYLGMPAEEIYDIIPSPSDPPPGEFPIEIGTPIVLKNGKYGVVTAINVDGTFEVDEITKEAARALLEDLGSYTPMK